MARKASFILAATAIVVTWALAALKNKAHERARMDLMNAMQSS